MSRPPTLHDNTAVCAYLADLHSAWELEEAMPEAGDIFTGALALKTSRCTSTRTLSRKMLFRILRRCEAITAKAIEHATSQRYAPRTVDAYAALARVVSKALEGVISKQPEGPRRPTLKDAQDMLDAPYVSELRAAGLVWPFLGTEFPQPKEEGVGRQVGAEFPQPKEASAPRWKNRLWEFNFHQTAGLI